MTSRSASLPSVRGKMIDIQFTHLTKDHFNGIKENNYGNVPIDKAVSFFKRVEDYEIDFQRLVNRRTGHHIKDLQFDLNNETEMEYFSISTLENFRLDLE